MGSQDDLVALFMKRKEQLQEARTQEFLEKLSPEMQEAIKQPVRKKWSYLDEMNRALEKKRQTVTPKPIDKAKRKQEIEHELDIIKGIVPTPIGYIVKPEKVKQLVKELRELNA